MHEPVFRFVHSLNIRYQAGLQDDIGDMVNEAFYVLWSKRAKLFRHPNIDAWLYVTARNKFMDRSSRQRTAQKHYAFSFDEDGRFSISDESLGVAALEEIIVQREAIISIVGQEQHALLLQYFDEHIDNADIAASLGITRSSLRSKVSRMIHALRDENFALFLLLLAAFYRDNQ